MTPIILAAAVLGQIGCFPRDEIVIELAARYNEHPVMRAMEERGAMVEIFASPSGTWTMVAIDGDLLACPVAFGTGMVFAPK
jgi:hypothetical protein